MDTTLPPDMQAGAQALITDAAFDGALHTMVARHFPQVGDAEVSHVMMLYEAPRGQTQDKTLSLTMIAFAPDTAATWNDHDKRYQLVEGLGAKCAKEGHRPVAAFLVSEVWHRPFTPEEAAARGNRQVESYDDKQEAVAVFGRTLDGRVKLATQIIEARAADGRIERLGEVDYGYDDAHSDLLDAFYRGFLRQWGVEQGLLVKR